MLYRGSDFKKPRNMRNVPALQISVMLKIKCKKALQKLNVWVTFAALLANGCCLELAFQLFDA